MVTIATATWHDSASAGSGNEPVDTQPGAFMTLAKIDGWVAFIAGPSTLNDSDQPPALGELVGIQHIAHGGTPHVIGSTFDSTDWFITAQTWHTAAYMAWPAGGTQYIQLEPRLWRFSWRGARRFVTAQDWYVSWGPLYGSIGGLSSGAVRFVWW